MKDNAQKNVVMLAATAVALFVVNAGIWFLAKNGAIAPIENSFLWVAFVVLNVVSIVWATSLLGLQPMVVAVAYTVGGVLSFLGVKGTEGVNVAEVATAGATYGAFGALAVGNAMTKMRLAFFNKGQVPFAFIIVGLLVVDAILNSQVSNAGGKVILNAVLLPFAVAGVGIGFAWSMVNRFVLGGKPAAGEGVAVVKASETKDAAPQKLVIEVPASAAAKSGKVAQKAEPTPVVKPAAKPTESPAPAASPAVAKAAPSTAKPAPVAAPVKPVAKQAPVSAQPEVKPTAAPIPPAAKPVSAPVQPAAKPAAAPVPSVAQPVMAKIVPPAPKKDEEFLPLEIDKDDAFEAAKPSDSAKPAKKDTNDDMAGIFASSAFMSNLLKENASAPGSVLVKGASPVVASEKSASKASAPASAAAATKVEAEPKTDASKPASKSPDWLNGHMDLLNRLK